MYDWQRRWIPRGVGGEVGGDSSIRARAFQAVWQLQYASEDVLLEELRDVPCLILLGEPGMGKTYALRREQSSLEDLSDAGSVKTHHVDLAGSQTAEDVRAKLFGNETYRDWKSGAHRLTWFIDSVDQTLMPVEHVITVISNELAEADVGRLQLRLVCRDHDWSLSLADSLRHCWRNDIGSNVRVYQLAALNADDIRLAAAANDKDPDAFIRQVEDANALPLATIPITLEMLLQTDEMTDSRVDLYRSGIRRLCEMSEERLPLTEKKRLQRFEMASRIAAVMVSCNKYWVDIYGNTALNESSLGIPELLVNRESEDEERLLRATLKSALFHGTGQRYWAHQSFAEYLTAYFLSNESISVSEIVRLTTTPDGKFAQQLHEMLRWLIDMRPDVLKEVIGREPMLVLKSDLSHLSEREYRKYVKTLLSLDDSYVYSHHTWELRKFRASHPSAKKVLLPYLNDIELSTYLRRFVFRLLESHGFPEMDDTLVDLSLNEYEDYALRTWAVRGLRDRGTVEAKLQLKQFISGTDDDPDDELKGYALQALWPDHLTAGELFYALDVPKHDNYFGSYKEFLSLRNFVNDIRPIDLPAALNWVAAQRSHHDMPFALHDFPGKIMCKAWDNIHVPGVMEAFTQTAIEMSSRFDGIFGGNAYDQRFSDEVSAYNRKFAKDVETRRKIVTIALPIWRRKDVSTTNLLWGDQPFVHTSDLNWLIGLLDASHVSGERCQLANLIAGLLGRVAGAYASTTENYRLILQVYYASQHHPELSELTQRFFVSKLDDPKVVEQREHHYEMKKFDEERSKALVELRPLETVHTALDRFDNGDVLQWLNMVSGLSQSQDGRHYSWNFQPDLTDFPSWESCDAETQQRIIRAAKTYVVTQECVSTADDSVDWYDTCSVSYVELYGYLAIFLLQTGDANALEHISPSRWNRWSKIIVWFPYTHIVLNDGRTDYHYHTRDLQQNLLRRLYRNAPQALLDNLRKLIVAEDSRDSTIASAMDKVEHLWDVALEGLFLNLLRASSLSAKAQRSLLDYLLKHGSADAVRFAQETIRKGYSDEMEKERLVEFCAGLLLSELEFDWQTVWKEIQNDEDVGKAIVENIADEDRRQLKFSDHLTVRELADLFIWVEERFPSEEDPQVEGFHAVSPRKQVGYWRNKIIAELRKKDGQEALMAFRRILERFPHLEWLQLMRVDLEESVDAHEWIPAPPRKILQLTKPEEKRLQKWVGVLLRLVKRNWKWVIGLSARFLAGLS